MQHLFFIFVMATLISWNAGGASLSCSALFKNLTSQSLQSLFEFHRNVDPAHLRTQARGQWIELPQGQWVRYDLWGQKRGPIHLHLEGLGGRLEDSLKNPMLIQHARTGRVLVIELEGQGLREVHQRLQLDQNRIHPTRRIDFHDNLDSLNHAYRLILQREKVQPHHIASVSGHSFGGLKLAYFFSQQNWENHRPLVQFVASGVANHNLRLLDSTANRRIELLDQWAHFILPNVDRMAIQKATESLGQDPLLQHFEKDLIQIESAIALTMGASKVDATLAVQNFPPSSRLQVLTGEQDNVVFAMLHWELAEVARQAGHPTTLVLIEGAGHFITQETTASQIAQLRRLTQNPHQFDGYYYLTRQGRLRSLTPEEAREKYRDSSLRTWEHQKAFIKSMFDKIGLPARYPESWL